MHPRICSHPRTPCACIPNNNKDTPLPPETPAGENPPAGAIIDYWLGANTSGPVTLQILDADGQVVKSYSSAQGPETSEVRALFRQSLG
jgi:hypothetical protein